MAMVKLDPAKMLGFRLVDTGDAAASLKLGSKAGAKAGAKVGAKIGGKARE